MTRPEERFFHRSTTRVYVSVGEEVCTLTPVVGQAGDLVVTEVVERDEFDLPPSSDPLRSTRTDAAIAIIDEEMRSVSHS